MSLAYIHRQVRINKDAMTKIEHPAFYGVQEASHIIHKTHHRGAVKIIALYRDDEDLTNPDADSADGMFPFIVTPESKNNKRPVLAEWSRPSIDERLKFTKLVELCTEIQSTGRDVDMTNDYTLMIGCCKSCNSTMTMEFWFRYHLFADEEDPNAGNPNRIIRGSPIYLRNVRITGGIQNLDDYNKWTANSDIGNFPSNDTPGNKNYMAPAVAYYLHMCLPYDRGHALHTEGKALNKVLYVEMCWVVLEITCLMCEYWRGSGDKENKQGSSKKRNQSHKSPLGAIELYFGYFCW
jgi:hypothetical protein